MATIHNGILGGFSGKIGTVIGSSWNGIQVIRSLPTSTKKEPSVLQLEQRARFGLVSRFLKPLADLLSQTYDGSAKRMSSYNKALSENSRVITGNYPSIEIDYPNIKLSKCGLPLGAPPAIGSPEAGKLLLSWQRAYGLHDHLLDGFAFIAAYSPDQKRWIYNQFVSGGLINKCEMDVAPFAGMAVHVYAGFISLDNKKRAESRYMGLVNIS